MRQILCEAPGVHCFCDRTQLDRATAPCTAPHPGRDAKLFTPPVCGPRLAIRDASCCRRPLNGGPCLRVGPCRACRSGTRWWWRSAVTARYGRRCDTAFRLCSHCLSSLRLCLALWCCGPQLLGVFKNISMHQPAPEVAARVAVRDKQKTHPPAIRNVFDRLLPTSGRSWATCRGVFASCSLPSAVSTLLCRLTWTCRVGVWVSRR